MLERNSSVEMSNDCWELYHLRQRCSADGPLELSTLNSHSPGRPAEMYDKLSKHVTAVCESDDR